MKGRSHVAFLALLLSGTACQQPPTPPAQPALATARVCPAADTACLCPINKGHFGAELSCLTQGMAANELAHVSLHGRTAQFLSDTARVEQTLYPLLDQLALLPLTSKPAACAAFTPEYRRADNFGPRQVFQLTLCTGQLDASNTSSMDQLATDFARAEQSLRAARAAAPASTCALPPWTSETWWRQRNQLVGAQAQCYRAQLPHLSAARCQFAATRAQRICSLMSRSCTNGRLAEGCQPTTAHCGAAEQVAALCSGY